MRACIDQRDRRTLREASTSTQVPLKMYSTQRTKYENIDERHDLPAGLRILS